MYREEYFVLSDKMVPVATISERGDDETARVTKVFVPILQLSVYHPGSHVLLLPVITQLTQPLEIVRPRHS